ncbi:DNA-binding protein [Segatella asaccharophila]
MEISLYICRTNTKNMNKTQLTAALAAKVNVSKLDAARYVNAVLGIIADNACEGDEEVSIPDFGRFYEKHVSERQGINPATGEKIVIEAHDKVVFKPSDNLCIFSRKHS